MITSAQNPASGIISEQTDGEVQKENQALKKLAPSLAAMAAGGILTGVRFAGSMSVFGISLVSALPFPLGAAALTGGIIG
ncbi:MAG: hypothetical protein K2K57_09525 [Oscillospiraceae bacterium]|nr:hypothetical protein [Oscillospiraceae bacterium]